MTKPAGAMALAAVALFMLLGFVKSDVAHDGAAALIAFVLVVGLPAAGAVLLVRSHLRERAQRDAGRDALARRNIDTEILRLAQARGGRLTAMEVATHLTMAPEEAKTALEALALRGLADYEVTDAGILVYSFYEIRHLGGKESARGILDA